MKALAFLFLFALILCPRQEKPSKEVVNRKDTTQTEKPKKKKQVTIVGAGQFLPLYVVMGNDTVYNYVAYRPKSSVDTTTSVDAGVNKYIEDTLKSIHIGEGISYVSYVVNKKGQPCHVSISRSAKNNVFDAELAERMDSTACEIIRNMPSFIPARNKEGEFVNYRMHAIIRFR